MMIGTMVGNFPNPVTIGRDIASGKIDDFPWQAYMYFVLACLLSLAGLIAQCVMKKKDEKDKHKKGDHYVNLK